MGAAPGEGEAEDDSHGVESEIKDFDDIFQYIGGWGPFQVDYKQMLM